LEVEDEVEDEVGVEVGVEVEGEVRKVEEEGLKRSVDVLYI
jgi:hypothetical protein